MSKVSDYLRAIALLDEEEASHFMALSTIRDDKAKKRQRLASELENGDEPEPAPEPQVHKFTHTPTESHPRWRDKVEVKAVSRAEFRVTVTPREPPPNDRGMELFYVAHLRPRDGKMEYRQLILIGRRTPTGIRLVASAIDEDKTQLDLPGKIKVGSPNVLEVAVDLGAGEMSGTWAGEDFSVKLHPDGAEGVDGPIGVQVGGDNAWPGAETTIEVRFS